MERRNLAQPHSSNNGIMIDQGRRRWCSSFFLFCLKGGEEGASGGRFYNKGILGLCFAIVIFLLDF